jgi:glycosyltransferase involved in cell wall biosynthesis
MAETLGVCFIFDDFHPVFSGHSVYMQQIMARLPRSWRLSVIARNPGGLPEREDFGRIAIVRVPDDPSSLRHALNVARTLLALRHDYHCVHLNGFPDRYELVLALLKFLRRRIVVQVTLFGSDDAHTFVRCHKVGRLRLRLLARLVDMLTGISAPLVDSYRDYQFPQEKLILLPQGVDIGRYLPADVALRARRRAVLGLAGEDRVAVFVGTVMRRKGVDILLEAWSTVQSRVPGARLLLVGMHLFDAGHASRSELEAFVAEQRRLIVARDLHVDFAGLVDDVPAWLQAADVFVLPSRKEGFGNVILEAMACALPCVVTPMDGVAFESVVPGETGYVVEDADALADAVSELFADSGRAVDMGRRGRERVLAHFDLEHIAARYRDLYAPPAV